MRPDLRLIAVSESALMVYFAKEVELSLPSAIRQLCDCLQAQFGTAILNLTPSYTSLLVEYHPLRTNQQQLSHFITTIKVNHTDAGLASSVITLPAYYATEVGPDLTIMANQLSLSSSAYYPNT